MVNGQNGVLRDTTPHVYAQTRINHWNSIAYSFSRRQGMRQCYHRRLSQVYRFLVPPGSRILEIGCGQGDLLASLEPSQGVGLDFSPVMIEKARKKYPEMTFWEHDIHAFAQGDLPPAFKQQFDAIILSDLVNDLWDVREALQSLHKLCSTNTRIVFNFHSHLWAQPARWAQKIGAMTPLLEQNWLTTEDMTNLLHLAGFEVIRRFDDFIWPWNTPLLEPLCNRWLAKILPFRWLDLTHFMVCRMELVNRDSCSVSVVIPARNEAGNIQAAVERTPEMGTSTEIIFVEGNSTDNTWDIIQQVMAKYPDRHIRAYKQSGKGKGDAVRKGFNEAHGDVLMILDADLTVPPEVLPQFYQTYISGKAEFVNGVRLVYPQEKRAMRFLNLLGNKFFSLAFSWMLGRNIKDTLCGTKVLSNYHYRLIASNRHYFGEFDPFGDYDLLFGAAKMNLKIVDLPVRYRERTYGDTNIHRWQHGLLLFRMVLFAAERLKFI